MKKLKPIRVEKFTRLTEHEMKNVFGGDSGNDGPETPGENPKYPGMCVKGTSCSTSYYNRGNQLYSKVNGTCSTHSRELTNESGDTVTVYSCQCTQPDTPIHSNSGGLTMLFQDCAHY